MKKFDILLVEDRVCISRYIQDIKNDIAKIMDLNFKKMINYAQAVKAIGNHSFDLIIIDMTEPMPTALDVLNDFNGMHSKVPILAVTKCAYSLEIDFVSSDPCNGNINYLMALMIKYAFKNKLYNKKFDEANQKNLNLGKNCVTYKCDLDRYWTMRQISSNVLQMTGYNASDLINNNQLHFSCLIHPEDSFNVTESISKQIQHDGSYQVEYRIIDRSGEIKWLTDCGKCVEIDDDGACLTGVLVDITHLKKSSSYPPPNPMENQQEILGMAEKISEDVDDVLKLIKDTNLAILDNQNTIVGYEKLKNNLFVADSLLTKLGVLLGGYSQIDKNYEIEKIQPKYERFPIAKKIKQVVGGLIPIAATKGLNLFASIPNEDLTINGDEKLMVEMLDNLICSFIKFTSFNGGNIYLYVNEIEDDIRIDVQTNRSNLQGDKLYQLLNLDLLEQELYVGVEDCDVFNFIKNVVQVHNGRVWVDKEINDICGISIQLPTNISCSNEYTEKMKNS